MRRILFFTHRNPQGYRIQQYFPFLEKAGCEPALVTTDVPFGRFLEELKKSDVLYVQRILLNPLKLLVIRRLIKRIIYDFDDAVMYGSHGESGTRRRKFRSMIKQADAVMCGNHFLLDEARRYRKADVFYVPTVVDTDEYPVKTSNGLRGYTVGWIGSSSTLKYLMSIEDLLRALTAEGVTVKVIADSSPPIPGLIFQQWQKDMEKQALLSLDAGIMPTGSDLWSCGKCGLKLIQYMASGLPTVSHPFGVATEIITDGVEGFLRADTEGWKHAIEEIGKDIDLRRRMGKAARQTAEERYSLRAWGPKVAEIMAGI